MKTKAEIAQTAKIKVVIWAGSEQVERLAADYDAAMKIVAREHRNAYDPAFYDVVTVEQLFDADGCFLTDDGRSVS